MHFPLKDLVMCLNHFNSLLNELYFCRDTHMDEGFGMFLRLVHVIAVLILQVQVHVIHVIKIETYHYKTGSLKNYFATYYLFFFGTTCSKVKADTAKKPSIAQKA